MACSSVNMPASHIITARRSIIGDNHGLRRSSSGEDLCKHAPMKRSFSDNNLLHSSSPLRAPCCTRSSLLKPSQSIGIFSNQTSSSILQKETEDVVNGDFGSRESEGKEEVDRKIKKSNWMSRLLELRTRWKGKQEKDVTCENQEEDGDCEDGCSVYYGDRFDPKSFSKLLVQVSWLDAERLSKLASLGNMAYNISKIKDHNMLLDQGLHMITSSLEKKAEAAAVKTKLDWDSILQGEDFTTPEFDSQARFIKKGHTIRASTAYEIAASAASHVQCLAKKESYSCNREDVTWHEDIYAVPRGCNSERAAQMAASTMTAVVAAREREKQAVAKELQSLHSSPCEWFICDDPTTHVRYFVIQGSESLASWQANLFFEPTKFEETDVLVHRGIYEAAKGHSLGGSLSLLVHIMVISSRMVKPSALLPVVTFGSPFIFCGGDKIMEQLGLEESMVQSVILHRDIVPRAFSCNYPRQVALVLERLNGSFRTHPCLNKHKMLYSPVGRIFIIQPSEKLSPPHPMLPPGCGLYAFDNTQRATSTVALRTFMNTPHPLETLSNPTAYGSEGTIIRDHDSKNYTKAVSDVLKQYRKFAFRNVRKERHLEWPLIVSPTRHTWTHKSNLENRSARKELMSSV
ncbi:hypothetical protein vseg_009397 [Gypsophila vaccaria]